MTVKWHGTGAYTWKSRRSFKTEAVGVESRAMIVRRHLALALAIVCGAAHAAWTEISRFDDGMRIYVDRSSVRRDGDTAEVMHLVRWAEAQQDEGLPAYHSTVVRTLYDCKGKRERYLESTSFAGPMGDGAAVVADENAVEGWYSISEASMEDKLWSIACGRR